MFALKALLEQQTGEALTDLELISSADRADDREWLITDATGSYASAALSGANTRRYHALLVGALHPPVERNPLFMRVDEVLSPLRHEQTVASYQLATNFWRSGSIAPEGFKHIAAFTHMPTPTWLYKLPDGWLVKQSTMLPGERRQIVGYTWLAKPQADEDESPIEASARLRLHLLTNYRSFHGETRGFDGWKFQQVLEGGKLTVRAFDGAAPVVVRFDRGSYSPEPGWYWNYFWPEEHARGLNDGEDCFHVGCVEAVLKDRESITLCFGVEDRNHISIGEAVKRTWARKLDLLKKANNPTSKWARVLVLAADQFLAFRESTQSWTVIAGYPWFNDWGRDSMISLPGLTLVTGRPDIAKSVLKTFGKYLDAGMLPNNFPDVDQKPDYNTVDATLWWAWALHEYYALSGDFDFVKEQVPLLKSVIEHHLSGTRYGIKVDPEDGLLTAGAPGVQLTWMDAKVGDYVVTPREGKAVEINALWFNFLKVLEYFHLKWASLEADSPAEEDHKAQAQRYAELASKTQAGFEKFWQPEKGYLVDVIGLDGTIDAALRPNQLIALSLQFPILDKERGKSVLHAVEEKLLTPVGLRSLSPDHPDYKGIYGCGLAQADQYHRDITYHQGTVWPWLLGPWADARLNVFDATADNVKIIEEKFSALQNHTLFEAGIGSISEIFDADEPHRPRGCYAQAWSVAEILRVLQKLSKYSSTAVAS